ncbi:MAG: nucleotidyl transferase AbiEii/AbiGii toxin family protein [Candidatus Aminicenantes bacterium]|nr:nucleotidyl transferase AbiEii/AbiGii toxin family protein [Candidatus Aminicenantes bacterium]
MKEREIKDISASVRARLFNIAKQTGREFDAVVLQYLQERFLYRVSASSFKDNFVLKGALLLLTLDISTFRPTKDIDMLGIKIPGSVENIKKIMQQIAGVECNDGIHFNRAAIEAEKIKEGAEYEGVRVKIETTLGKIRRRLQLDIGFNDVMAVGPTDGKFPVLLDFPIPRIKFYSFESVIAEKFEAIVKLDYQTSRMKDFYDIHFLTGVSSFEMKKLKKAILATFKHRGTDVEKRRVVFADEYKSDPTKKVQWEAFLRKNGLEAAGSFNESVGKIEQFLEPIFTCETLEDVDYTWIKESWTPGIMK